MTGSRRGKAAGFFRRVAGGLIVLGTALGGALWGQESGVPVVIDGQELARVYGSVGTFTPKDRAPQIADRIRKLAEQGFTGTIATREIPSERATAVVAGSVILMAVTEIDAQSAGVPQQELAKRYAAAIQTAIEGYRARHTWFSFLVAVAKTVLAWAVFLVSALLLWRTILWLGRRLELRLNQESPEGGSNRVRRVVLESGRIVVIIVLKFVAGLTLLAEFSFVTPFCAYNTIGYREQARAQLEAAEPARRGRPPV